MTAANNRRALEIMAPAGNFECLHAAIQGGADSVYFGVEKLNMLEYLEFADFLENQVFVQV